MAKKGSRGTEMIIGLIVEGYSWTPMNLKTKIWALEILTSKTVSVPAVHAVRVVLVALVKDKV